MVCKINCNHMVVLLLVSLTLKLDMLVLRTIQLIKNVELL